MTNPGREDVAEISRLCRAFMATYAELPPGADPADDSMIRQLADEIQQLRIPANSILFMASMVKAMHNRMRRVAQALGAGSAMTFDAIQREMLQKKTAAPPLVEACFDVIRETERPVRDQERLTDVVVSCGEQWGVAANLTLAYIYTGIARGVVAIDPSVETLGALLAEVSLDEEVDLLAKGEG